MADEQDEGENESLTRMRAPNGRALASDAKRDLCAPLNLRFFISSPGDVPEERLLALELIDKLQKRPAFKKKVTALAITWDAPHASVPMDATRTPQLAVNDYAGLPSDCDLTIVFLWSKLGTPLPKEETRADGTPYASGTMWELEDAQRAGKEVWIYRRDEVLKLERSDPEFDAKRQAYDAVETFFDGFNACDGSITRGYQRYKTVDALKHTLEEHLETFVTKRLDALRPPAGCMTERGLLELSAPTQTRALRPSLLLLAQERVVPFDETLRVAELSRIDDWSSSGHTLSLNSVWGPSGAGKTRLLQEVCERKRAQGWHAGFLPQRLRGDLREVVSTDTRPIFLCIDNAELRRELAEEVESLLSAARGRRQTLHIILLARTIGQWWGRLVDRLYDLQRPPSECALSPIPLDVRVHSACRAAQVFAERLGTDAQRATAQVAPFPFDSPAFAWPLHLHALGLVAAVGGELEEHLLLDSVLKEELKRLRELLAPHSDQHHENNLLRAIAAIDLVGGTRSDAETRALVARVTVGSDSQASVLLALSKVLPVVSPADGDDDDIALGSSDGDLSLGDSSDGAPRAGGLGPLQTDHVGLPLLQAVLALPDSKGFLTAVLQNAQPDVLWRAAHMLYAIGREPTAVQLLQQLCELLEQRAESIGSNAATALAVVADVFVAWGRHDEWADTAARALAITARRAESDPMGPATAELALQAAAHGSFLALFQQDAESVTAYEQAEKAVLALADRAKSELAPLHALIVQELGTSHIRLKQPDRAIARLGEAVELWRELSKSGRALYARKLAMALATLAEQHRVLRQDEAALAILDEALVSARHGDSHRAIAESERTDSLLRLGDINERVAFAPSASQQLLLTRDGDLSRATVSLVHTIRGHALIATERAEEALQALEQALAIQRELDALCPEEHRGRLMIGLSSLGMALRANDRLDEAEAVMDELVRVVADIRPSVSVVFGRATSDFVLQFADAQGRGPQRAQRLLQAGLEQANDPQGLAALRSARSRFTWLARVTPELADRMVATSMMLAIIESGLRQNARAAEEAALALTVFDALDGETTRPAIQLKWLHGAVVHLLADGRFAPCQVAAEQAVSRARELLKRATDAGDILLYRSLMLDCLQHLAHLALSKGKTAIADAYAREALQLTRWLTKRDPRRFAEKLKKAKQLVDSCERLAQNQMSVRTSSLAGPSFR